VHVLFHTPQHLGKGKIESHLAKTLSQWPMQAKSFLTKLLQEMSPSFLPMTRNKATEFWMGWWDIPLAEEIEIPKVQHQDHVDNFCDFHGLVHKEFVQEGKTVKADFYKGVRDCLLKHIQRVRPAVFCSRDCFLLHNNAPAHSAASVCQFLTAKNVTTLYPPSCILQICLRQTIFCSPSWKWN